MSSAQAVVAFSAAYLRGRIFGCGEATLRRCGFRPADSARTGAARNIPGMATYYSEA